MRHEIAIAICGLVLAVTTPAARAAAAPEASNTKAGCVLCHAADKKGVGPTYREIAARYKTDAKARQTLIDSVRKGSKGKWAKAIMPPTPPAKISDADLATLVDWILKRP